MANILSPSVKTILQKIHFKMKTRIGQGYYVTVHMGLCAVKRQEYIFVYIKSVQSKEVGNGNI